MHRDSVRHISHLLSIGCIVILFDCALLFGQQRAEVQRTSDTPTTANLLDLRNYLESLVETKEVPGLVAIVSHRDKTVLDVAIGSAEIEPRRRMTRDAIFRLASMTKPLTSAAVLMLVDRNKLRLTDPVSKYVPELEKMKVVGGQGFANEPITIHHLLTHQSGLTYHDAEKIGQAYANRGIQSGVCRSARTLEQNIRELAEIPLLFEPGSDTNYGMSTDVLGLVVERVAGDPLDRFIEDNICRPLGMSDTHFFVPPQKRTRMPATFVWENQALRELNDNDPPILHPIFLVPMSSDHPYFEEQRYVSGGGGISGTAADYLKFCQMVLNGGTLDGRRVLSTQSTQLMTTNQIGDGVFGTLLDGTSYQFGYGLSVLPDGETAGERGWGGIWGTVFRIDLEDDWAAVLLTQRILDESFRQREVEFTRLVRKCFRDAE